MDVEVERDILKKAVSMFLHELQKKYWLLKSYTGRCAVQKVCKVVKMKRSFFYQCKSTKSSKWALENKVFAQQIQLFYSQSK
jgi:hypothetical protein